MSEPSTSSAKNAYTIMRYIVENDTGLIYGDTGTGKSQLVLAIMRHALEAGAKIAICDTEGNYSGTARSWLEKNCTYMYTTKFANVLKWATTLPAGYDLVVLDSLGAPVLGAFALANLRERGSLLLGSEALAYTLKTYAQENKAMALITNQPVSEMNKARDMKTGKLMENLEPFGGKTNFFWKEVLRSEKTSKKDVLISTFSFKVHKSRHMPTGYELATMRLTNSNVEIEFAPYSGTKGADLPEIKVRTKGEKRKQSNGNSEPKKKGEAAAGSPPKKETADKSNLADEDKAEKIKEEAAIQHVDNMLEEIDAARESLNRLINERGLNGEKFMALARSAGLGEIASTDELKTLDAINEMIELARESASQSSNDNPVGLFDE